MSQLIHVLAGVAFICVVVGFFEWRYERRQRQPRRKPW